MGKSIQVVSSEDEDLDLIIKNSMDDNTKNGGTSSRGGTSTRGGGGSSARRGGGSSARGSGGTNARGGGGTSARGSSRSRESSRGRMSSSDLKHKSACNGDQSIMNEVTGNPAKKLKLDISGSGRDHSPRSTGTSASRASSPLDDDESQHVVKESQEITLTNDTYSQLHKMPNGNQIGGFAGNETLLPTGKLFTVGRQNAPGSSTAMPLGDSHINVKVTDRETKDPEAVNVHHAENLPIVAVDNVEVAEPADPLQTQSSPLSIALTQNLSFSWTHLIQNRTSATNLVMKAWYLHGSKEDLSKHFVLFDKEKNLLDHPLRRFLEGEKETSSVYDFMDFLSTQPEKVVGSFIVGLMIVEYVTEMDVECLADLFKNKVPDEHPFRDVFKTMLLYRLQRGIRCNKEGFKLIDVCPASLWDDLNFDMINQSKQVSDVMANQGEFKETREESCHLETVRSLLQKMIFMDMKNDSRGLLDTEARTFKTAEIWLRVLNLVIRQMPEENRKRVFHMLITALRDTDTKVYFHYKKDNAWEPVHLNPFVVGLWINCPLQRGENVDEIESTVQTFVDMLYDIMDAMSLDKCIAPGVYRLAKRLKICDIYQFVFKGKTYKDLIDESNKVQLLHLLIKLERNNDLDEIASNFDTWIPAKQRSMFLDGLDAEEVVSFMGRKCLRLGEDEVYELLLKWSFESSGKEFPSKKIYYDDAVNVKFNLVRRAIFLMEIKDYAPLIRHRYVSFGDILQAKSLCQKMSTDEESSDPGKFWFSVGYRTKMTN